MRPIKFRAWHKRESKMLDWQEIQHCHLYLFETDNDLELMQFTGLLDGNGVEIYEGDIVEFTYWWFDGNPAESLLTGEIIYAADCMSFALKGIKNNEWLRHVGGDSDTTAFAFFNFNEADFSVIGNIHEHRELIEV